MGKNLLLLVFLLKNNFKERYVNNEATSIEIIYNAVSLLMIILFFNNDKKDEPNDIIINK